MDANPIAKQELSGVIDRCSQVSGVSGVIKTNQEPSLLDPWKTSLGGAKTSLSYTCDCYCMRWSYSVSDIYDWKSILRDGKLHRSVKGQIIALGFDLVQDVTRCLLSGHWKEFPIIGSCGGGSCPK